MGNGSTRTYALDTLRYVRLMLLVVPLLLVVAIVIYAIVNHRIEDSISSYYLGPARDLFVAMLVTTAVLLVVYAGAALEDFSLNLAGFYAMFVALVPTHLEATLSQLSPEARSKLILSVRVAIVAILVVTLVFAWLGWRTNRLPRHELMYTGWSTFLVIASSVLLAGFLVLLLWRAVQGTDFAGVHACAALLMICSMGVAIASHLGHPRLCPTDTSGGRRIHYGVLLILMLLGLLAWPVLVLAGVRQAVFIVEWFQIGLFSYYWFLESRRLWHREDEVRHPPRA